MTELPPLVITISRQMGSGGAEIGQMLAKRLDWTCLDREIVTQAAELLAAPVESLSHREESAPRFWQTLASLGSYISRDAYIPPQITYTPTEKDLFAAQSEVIRKAARVLSEESGRLAAIQQQLAALQAPPQQGPPP